jgi:hypothetical protein
MLSRRHLATCSIQSFRPCCRPLDRFRDRHDTTTLTPQILAHRTPIIIIVRSLRPFISIPNHRFRYAFWDAFLPTFGVLPVTLLQVRNEVARLHIKCATTGIDLIIMGGVRERSHLIQIHGIPGSSYELHIASFSLCSKGFSSGDFYPVTRSALTGKPARFLIVASTDSFPPEPGSCSIII